MSEFALGVGCLRTALVSNGGCRWEKPAGVPCRNVHIEFMDRSRLAGLGDCLEGVDGSAMGLQAGPRRGVMG